MTPVYATTAQQQELAELLQAPRTAYVERVWKERSKEFYSNGKRLYYADAEEWLTDLRTRAADVVVLTMVNDTLVEMIEALQTYADSGFEFALPLEDRIVVSKIPMENVLNFDS